MQSGFGGPGGDVEDGGRLRERQADVEVEDEDGALVDGQAAQLALETVALDEGRRLVGRSDRLPVGRRWNFDQRASLLTTSRDVAGSNREPVEPGVPRFRVAEGAQASPGRDERILDRILGPIPVTENEGGDGVLTRRRRVHQVGERLVVAPDRPFHELSLHATTGRVRRIRSHSPLISVCRTPKRFPGRAQNLDIQPALRRNGWPSRRASRRAGVPRVDRQVDHRGQLVLARPGDRLGVLAASGMRSSRRAGPSPGSGS